MKTKILAFLLICVMVFQGTAFASFQLGTENAELVVGGEASPYERVTFVLINSDALGCADAEETIEKYEYNILNDVTMTASEIFRFSSVSADKNGKWSYTIPMTGTDISGADMEDESYTLNLTLLSSAGNEEFIRYSSIAYRKNIIPILQEKAAKDSDGTALSGGISEYIEYITDGEIYKKLDNKKIVAKFNYDLVKSLDASAIDALEKLKKGIDEAVLVQAVKEGVVEDFDSAMEIVSYNKAEEKNISEEGKAKVVELLKKKESYENVDEYKAFAAKQFSLQLFNYNVNQTGEALLKVLRDNKDNLELELISLEKLTESNAEYAAKQVAAKKCESLTDLQIQLNAIVRVLSKSESGSGSSGGGGGGGGGGSMAAAGKENLAFGSSAGDSISDEYIQEHKYIYNDLNKASWASDAVVFLAGKGIINGYEDNSFKPLNPITRAEFTKIIVETFLAGEVAKESVSFKDVKDTDWYSKYIYIAYENGIISGDGAGSFNPNAPISRQDMALIIYNAAKKFDLFADEDSELKFADDSAISDYAKTAVYTLKNKGIINGVGGNAFAPKDNANRASAAQIIYSLMNKYNR